MIESTQFKRVQLTNQAPLNQVARRFLPDQRASQTELAVISLMRWGMENGIQTTSLAPHHPDDDQISYQLDKMTRWEPRRTMLFLTNPENLEGEVVLTAEELAQQATPLEAAELLLENLYNAMVTTAP